MTPLALTHRQLDLVRQAAAPVPHEWRGRFLELVADRLLAYDTIDDATVFEATHTVLVTMFGRVA
jgi:hypothetical protein